jgi:hypothetical protein
VSFVTIAHSRDSTNVLTAHAARRFRHVAATTAIQPKPQQTQSKKATVAKTATKQETSYLLEKLNPELEFAAEELELLGGAPLPKIGLGDWVEAHR